MSPYRHDINKRNEIQQHQRLASYPFHNHSSHDDFFVQLHERVRKGMKGKVGWLVGGDVENFVLSDGDGARASCLV